MKTKERCKALFEQGIDASEIAAKLGITKATVSVHLRNLGLNSKVKRRETYKDKAERIGELAKYTKTTRELDMLSKELGIKSSQSFCYKVESNLSNEEQ